jgi:hypothetical protein
MGGGVASSIPESKEWKLREKKNLQTGKQYLNHLRKLYMMTYCVYSSQEVNIEFEAYSISDNDYDGIKKLLQQVLSLVYYIYICFSEKLQAFQHNCSQVSSFQNSLFCSLHLLTLLVSLLPELSLISTFNFLVS